MEARDQLGEQLGQLLVSRQLVAPGELARALAEQQSSGGRLGAILVRRGCIAEEKLVRILASQLRLPVARIRGKMVNPEVLELVPVEVAEKYRCLPLLRRRVEGVTQLFLALEDPSDRDALDELAFQLGARIQPVLIGPTELEDALQRHYHAAHPTGAGPALPPLPAPGPADAGETETAPELPPPDPLLHPSPADGEATAPQLGAAAAGPTQAPIPSAVEDRHVLRALSQLLVEKGVLGRDELAARLRALASGDREPA
jgi:hypothetical protein